MDNSKHIIKIIIFLLIIFSIIIYYFISDKNDISYSVENITEKEDVIENNNKIKVYITGEIINPGVIELEEGSRIEDAINKSGGLTNEACIDKVNLAYVLKDAQKIVIPNINNLDGEYIYEENGQGVIEGTNTKNIKVNINNADINELKSLPGIGESMAQKIIDYRKENGKFNNIEDLKNVSGIGEKKFESIKEYLTIK